MNVSEMLKAMRFKPQVLVTVKPDELSSAAIQKMADYNKGALPVCNDDGELIGIVTERDILRKCFAREGSFKNKTVNDIMTKKVAIARPDDELDYAIKTMKKEKIRHLPVADGKKIVGILSMRDILGFQYEETRTRIRYMQMFPRRAALGGVATSL
ncbi:MAG: CBS domain-containing protein [Smithellaceae bacterium]|nr:CBS domain-containing protein [Syntrophaceae bacterium]MDD4241276.1 CBS domain-containing protein [Smithellaceae bacterium]NLX52934.1 CBS domain-containing protein [Deltaproteobacteria bacterium]